MISPGQKVYSYFQGARSRPRTRPMTCPRATSPVSSDSR
jgi:hypothetical protein